MNEVGWCYLEGFGTKKDKVSIFSHPRTPSSIKHYVLLFPRSSLVDFCVLVKLLGINEAWSAGQIGREIHLV